MNTRPILSNNTIIKDDIEVNSRINRNDYFEMYSLNDGNYLYIMLDTEKEVSQTIKDKYKIFTIYVKGQKYQCFILKDNYENDLKGLYERLFILKGFDAVAGMKDLKAILMKDVIFPLRNVEKFKKLKVSIPNGILLYGPPGCGKTYIVRKLAEEIGYNYLDLKHSDFASIYVHGSVEKIAEIFDRAKRQAPSIVFIDEIEGLLPDRNTLTNNSTGKNEEVNEFLMHLNDAGKNGILVVGATNKIELIDNAVLRSGRFDKKIYVSPPDYDARKHLFEFYIADRPCQDIDYEALAGQTVNYACSDIEYLVNEASRKTAYRNMDKLTMDTLLETIDENNSSISEYFEL